MPSIGFEGVAEQLRSSTVQVQAGRGGGSGIIWSAGGTIVTNSHVIPYDRARIVTWDGRELHAKVEDRDAGRDLAHVRVAAPLLPVVRVRSSSELRAGELVVAAGNPLGLIGAVTMGVVHRVGPFGPAGGREWVQADIRLAPGSSGGPLADSQGRVIGINTMVADGLALAIPSDAVTRFLRRRGMPPPRLGVTARPVNTTRGFGWIVLDVEPGSVADRVSLLPGDLLVTAAGKPIGEPDDLAERLAGGVLEIQFYRPGSNRLRQVNVPAQGVKAEAV